jgi:hypothetical protein
VAVRFNNAFMYTRNNSQKNFCLEFPVRNLNFPLFSCVLHSNPSAHAVNMKYVAQLDSVLILFLQTEYPYRRNYCDLNTRTTWPRTVPLCTSNVTTFVLSETADSDPRFRFTFRSFQGMQYCGRIYELWPVTHFRKFII